MYSANMDCTSLTVSQQRCPEFTLYYEEKQVVQYETQHYLLWNSYETSF